MAKMFVLIAAIWGAIVMLLFDRALSAWKTGSSKIAKVGNVQKENKKRLEKAKEEAKQGHRMRTMAIVWGLLSTITACILLWILVFWA